jgi:Rrf2 family protein
MLSLTKKSEYALVAVCHMARVGRRIISAREIADQHGVPLPLLMNVLKRLNQAGFVRSVRGARGGYGLSIRPEQLTLAAVVEAVEGPVRLVNCVPGGASSTRRGCVRAARCSLRKPVHKLHARLVQFLAGVTISDLAFDEDYADIQHLPELGKAVAR